MTAQKDITWTEDLFARVFPGRDPTTLQLSDFGAALGRQWGELVDPNPRTRTFAGYVHITSIRESCADNGID